MKPFVLRWEAVNKWGTPVKLSQRPDLIARIELDRAIVPDLKTWLPEDSCTTCATRLYC